MVGNGIAASGSGMRMFPALERETRLDKVW